MPEFKSNLASLNDFPDPLEHLIGFFVPQKIKCEKEVPLIDSVSSKKNYSSFDQTYEKVDSQKNSSKTKNSKNKAKSYASKRLKEEVKSQSSKTARNTTYKLKSQNQRISPSTHSSKESKPLEPKKQTIPPSRPKNQKTKLPSTKASKTRPSVTSRLPKDIQSRQNPRNPKHSKSLLKPSHKKAAINIQTSGRAAQRGLEASSFKASEYYYQITNNINLSVDFNKYMTQTTFSDRNHSVGSDFSKPSEVDIVRRIHQKKQKLQTKRDLDTAKKAASRHISIVLNHGKPDLKQEFDIQVCNKQDKQKTKKKKKSMSPRGLKDSIAKHNEKKVIHSDKKKYKKPSPVSNYSPKGKNKAERNQVARRKKNLSSDISKYNTIQGGSLIDTNET